MVSTAEQMRSYTGPALFSYGFRPFFLFGALWSIVAVALWLPLLSGAFSLPIVLSPIEWHAHELIFGYVPAIVAGFLLTAVPNWTGRLPVVGTPLAALFSVWMLGRIAVLTSGLVGAVPAAVVDLSFLSLLCVVSAREIISAKNKRNFVVLGLLVMLLLANGLFHYEVATAGSTQVAIRLGIAVTITLIMLIGGRVTPSFTRNWLVRRSPGNLPAPSDKLDIGVLLVSAVALAAWVAFPDWSVSGALCILAASANLFRVGRWAGWRTTAEPLVVVLHIAFLFVPIGFALVGIAILSPAILTQSGAIHGWTTGAIAMMTLAIMTRASLGHTGCSLVASPSITLIYVSAFGAALARILAAFEFNREAMLHTSVFLWVVAFATFVIVFAPLLVRPKSK